MSPPPTSRDTYHHGDLARALVAATTELIAARGPSGFSLREVARQAGVSPSAPSHHFGDARGLLTAVAVDGFVYLDSALRRAIDEADTPADGLRAAARAYVDLGLRHPGHVAVMFRQDLLDTANPSYAAAAGRPYDAIEAVVAELIGETVGSASVDAAAKTMWATLNGFVNLYSSTADELAADPALAALVDAATNLLLAGFAHRGRGVTEPG